MPLPIATNAAWSSEVMSAGTAVRVYEYGQRISLPLVWSVTCVLMRWTPSTTRLATKAARARVSGAEKAEMPRYVSDAGFPDEPPQQPQW
jgi:hypothetical protein